MLYIRKERQGFINPNSKAGGGGGGSNHGLFTFLMVNCLGISIDKGYGMNILETEYTCLHKFTPINVQQIFPITFSKKRFASNMKTQHLVQPL